jgi:hypothetical protein
MNPKTITIKGITFTKIKPWGDERRLPWIEALESGKYKQAKCVLKDSFGSYCCLGVAAHVCGVPDSELLHRQILTANIFDKTREQLDLNVYCTFDDFIVGHDIEITDNCLTQLNDRQGFLFAEIALFLRWAMLPLEEVAA